MLKKYPGSKTASGIIHFLINDMPYHRRYFELFAGTAQLFEAKQPAQENYINDLSKDIYDYHRERNGAKARVTNMAAVQLISCFDFTPDDFIYLDPPYPFCSRRSGAAYYKHEMQDADHSELLLSIVDLKANIMISTRQNRLYDEILKGWRKEIFDTVDRVGPVQEIIYMNYPPPVFLHQYDYLGEDFTDRQRISRKVKRFEGKIGALPIREKHLLIIEMIKKDYAAVGHFLSMLPGKTISGPDR